MLGHLTNIAVSIPERPTVQMFGFFFTEMKISELLIENGVYLIIYIV